MHWQWVDKNKNLHHCGSKISITQWIIYTNHISGTKAEYLCVYTCSSSILIEIFKGSGTKGLEGSSLRNGNSLIDAIEIERRAAWKKCRATFTELRTTNGESSYSFIPSYKNFVRRYATVRAFFRGIHFFICMLHAVFEISVILSYESAGGLKMEWLIFESDWDIQAA